MPSYASALDNLAKFAASRIDDSVKYWMKSRVCDLPSRVSSLIGGSRPSVWEYPAGAFSMQMRIPDLMPSFFISGVPE
jgi:hypothetical protein